jgi:hypothetical protein
MLTPSTYHHFLPIIQVTTRDHLNTNTKLQFQTKTYYFLFIRFNHNLLLDLSLYTVHKHFHNKGVISDQNKSRNGKKSKAKEGYPRSTSPDSVKEAGLPKHGVAHATEIAALQRAASSLQHGRRLPWRAIAAACGRARNHLVRG